MYIYSTKSRARVVHRPGYRYLSAVKPENRAEFALNWQANDAGYRVCRCCNPLPRMLEREAETVSEQCARDGLSVQLNRMGELHIRTPHSKWILSASDAGMQLYHKNTLNLPEQGEPVFRGYHRQQDAVFATIAAYLRYIYAHDRFRLRHPVQPPKPVREPPRKGTRRYRSAMAKEKRRQHYDSVRRVYALLDALSAHA